MATSPGKTIGLVALIFLLLLLFSNIVPGIPGIFFVSESFPHFGRILSPLGLTNSGFGSPIYSLFYQFLPLGLLALWIAVTIWVYRDAERREMNGMLWALLVFVGNIIGLLIYLIVRSEETSRTLPSPSPPVTDPELCPSCSAELQSGFAFCPHCGLKMKEECPKCKKPVANEWQLCPFCGERLHRKKQNDNYSV